MLPLFIVWCAVLADVTAFFLFRFVLAALMGLRGRAARLGFDPDAWRAVPRALRLVFASVGPLGAYLVAAACFALSLAIGGDAHSDAESLRVQPAPLSPAEASGVQDGDRVVSIDGAPVNDWGAMRERIKAHQGRTVPIVVDRAGARVELQPIVGHDGRIGIMHFVERRPVGAGAAIVQGLERPFVVLATVVQTLFHHTEPIETMGPVGIVREVEKTSHDRSPVASALTMAGAILSYFLWVPALVAGILFPRRPP
jgi:membrane-associated protease RseP (regulator of RpoE activity)